MESPPSNIEEVIREKLQEYGVSEEKITHLLKDETQFVFWVKVMLVFAEISPELTLDFDRQRRRKWESDYIKQLRSLSTLWKYNSLISKLGLSKDDLSMVINDLDDEFGQIEKGKASRKRILKTTASYVLVGLRAIGLGQRQAVDFVYKLLKDTAFIKGIKEIDNVKNERVEKAKDRIRKWDEEANRILKDHPNLF